MNSRVTSQSFYEKAHQSLSNAELFAEQGRLEEAALSCYHSIFFSLRGKLLASGVEVTKTSDSIPAFSKQFLKPGVADSELYREDIRYVLALNGFDKPEIGLTRESVNSAIQKAERFNDFVSDHR